MFSCGGRSLLTYTTQNRTRFTSGAIAAFIIWDGTTKIPISDLAPACGEVFAGSVNRDGRDRIGSLVPLWLNSAFLWQGNFWAPRFAPMFAGIRLESEMGSNFFWCALFGSGYAGLGYEGKSLHCLCTRAQLMLRRVSLITPSPTQRRIPRSPW